MDIIGMTAVPEAQLAREAGICYAMMAHITDFDCWHESEEDVSVDAIIKVLKENAAGAGEMIRIAVKAIPERGACACHAALKDCVMTSKDRIPKETRENLDLIIGKYL